MCFARIALLAASVCVIAAEAQGAELQQPVSLQTIGLVSSPASDPDCPALPLHGPIEAGRLVIRDTDRPDVGPYTVKLPGYGTSATAGVQDFYRPFLVTAAPGDTLRFDMVNQLGTNENLGGAVNLHTHGLLVSARPCTPLGDYIFVHDLPGTTTHYRMDIPANLPGYMFGSQATPRPYPSGLNWFHAHVHGTAVNDVTAGQAGMLYVGDLRADLLAAPHLSPASANKLNRADTIYLGLRDIQLAVPADATPDQAKPGQRAQWLSGDDDDPGACPGWANPRQPRPTGAFSGPGYCGHHGVTTGGSTDPSQDTVWLFTINGQHYPTVTMQPGRNQIWRVANLSASLTYLLVLVDDDTGQEQPMTVLALDGLVAGTSKPDNDGLRIGVRLKRILLMPASRAEVLLLNRGGRDGRHLTLRTLGVTTGSAGDPWPRINLARVEMPPREATARSADIAVGPVDAMGDDMPDVPLDVTLPLAAPTSAVPFSTPGSAAAVPANCVTLPPASNRMTRRRITFTNDAAEDDFELGSEVVDLNGAPVDSQHTIPPQPFPMQAMLEPNSVKHVCPRLGEQEVWELVNKTAELHNFHLHQSKFRLAKPGDAGAPPHMTVVQDPTGIIAKYEPEAQGAVPTENVNVWHDVFPVPPSDGNGHDGRVFVTIPFYARQQLGSFVFHCHILEHEDGGMMAVVQVYDPRQLALNTSPSQSAELLRGAMCGVPAVADTPSVGRRLLEVARSALVRSSHKAIEPTPTWLATGLQ